jgi:predicted RNA-binding Zn-ribbon protein involved in translation (DUF1610 family)
MTSSGERTFDCPECGESILVNSEMQTVLIEQGCVVCSAPVTESDFVTE